MSKSSISVEGLAKDLAALSKSQSLTQAELSMLIAKFKELEQAVNGIASQVEDIEAKTSEVDGK